MLDYYSVDYQFVFGRVSNAEIVKAIIEVYAQEFFFKPRRDESNFKVIFGQPVIEREIVKAIIRLGGRSRTLPISQAGIVRRVSGAQSR